MGPAAGTVANPEEGYALDPWSRLRGRGERCLQSPLAVALSKAHGVPEPCKVGEIGHGAWLARGTQARERAPQRSPDPLPLWVHFEVKMGGGFGPFPGRLCPDAVTRPWN